MSWSWWRDRGVIALLGVALLVRLVAVVAFGQDPVGPPDPAFYWNAAQGIADGAGYRSPAGDLTAYFPPGYPYAVAAVIAPAQLIGITGPGPVFVVQALLGTLTVLFMVLAGHRLGGRTLALVAGGIVALWPNVIVYSAALLSETLYLAVFAAIVWMLMVAVTGGGLRWVLGAAVLLGLAALVRPQVLLAVPVLVVVWLIAGLGWRRALAWPALLAAGALLVILPWTVRNASVFHAFVPVSTNGGNNLCIGFGDAASGGFHLEPECDSGEFYTKGSTSELANDRILTQRAAAWIRDHPGSALALAVPKLRYTFDGDTDGLAGTESYGLAPQLSPTTRTVYTWAAGLYYAGVLGLAAIGAVILLFRRLRGSGPGAAEWTVLGLTVAGLMIPPLFFGDERFKVPVVTLLALLAAVTLTARHPRTPAPTGRKSGNDRSGTPEVVR